MLPTGDRNGGRLLRCIESLQPPNPPIWREGGLFGEAQIYQVKHRELRSRVSTFKFLRSESAVSLFADVRVRSLPVMVEVALGPVRASSAWHVYTARRFSHPLSLLSFEFYQILD